MTNQEAIEKFKRIKRGNIFLIHQRIEGKEVIEDYSLCDMAISALEAQEWIPATKKSHPDTPERVQVQLDNGWIITAYYQENEWLSVPDCGEPIQDRWIEAWRPLPELYRGDKDETD